MSKFEQMLGGVGATIGRAIDNGVADYNEASTHKVEVKLGDRPILSLNAPWEPIKENFSAVHHKLRAAFERVDSAVEGFVEKIGDVKFAVTPIEKKAPNS